ncbi:3-methyl-2-oxobutanoate hydroxymethyltransferase [Aquibacillus kalidii]|uniref:3-methyl-2-oxobutanoate hydroxymethyltransferase n=1 Tax=Aquibacillus kalidii TaxID=2762597 RepID=UPI0016472286|nr:3-methyl-2-oxobutanoate hydroxymethyltransferase [Aquibacillus kalidii]
MKNRVQLQKMKQEGEKITMLTAYDFPSAKLVEQADIDMILVGDSLGMVVLGYDSTIRVTVDDMIHHAKAVTRGARNTFVVVDMPFMSYHISLEESLKNARRIYQESNAQALKIEGASEEILKLTKQLTNAGIPVVAHIGLTPQSVNVLGGYRVQGKDLESARQLIKDAQNLEKSGAMAVVLECVPKELAKVITGKLEIPTIGIGAGVDCDGQVLVYHDVLQYGVDRVASFVKTYLNVNADMKKSLFMYNNEVKAKQFPNEDYAFSLNEEIVRELELEE